MSVAPHSGIIDFGTFTPPASPLDGIQGEVPAPLLAEAGYVLSTNGWVPAGGGGGSGTVTSIDVLGGTTGLTTSGGPVTTSGSITLAGTLAITNGGTGATTAANAINALLPTQTGNSGKVLGTDGSVASWVTASGGGAVTSVNGQTGIVVLDYADVGAASAAQGTTADSALQTITSSDGSIAVSTVGTAVDLTVSAASPASTLLGQVRNETGATLTKGTVIYISGAAGNKALVSKAIATSDATSAQTYGVITANILNNQNGYATIVGTVIDLDTSAFTEGVQLYLSSTTAGAYTATKQYAPAHLVYVGIVTRSHPTQGTIEVKIQNGYEMDELHNVSAQTPSNGNVLIWNNSTQLWVSAGITAGTGVSVTNGAGSITIANTGVTSVTGTAPVVSSGGATPAISMAAATTSVNGYLTSTDWNTFNNKGSGSVTSVGGTGTVSGISLSGTVTTSGNLTLGGTLDLSSPPAIGGSTPAAITGTTITATTFSGAGTSLTGTASSLSIGGNAATVTNGVYTTGSYADPTWITSLAGSKISGAVASATSSSVTTNVSGGAASQILYQTSTGVTNFITAPTVPSYLQWNGTSFNWTNPAGAGTVTSVSGTGSVNGLTLTGTVTTVGSLTLGGTLDLSSPPAIGGTTPAAIKATDITLTGGSYAEGVFGGTYVDGIVVDYDIASAVGRISVGGSDGLNFYNGGIAGSLLGSVSNNGDWSITRFLDVGNGTLIGGATNPLIAAAGSVNQYVQSYIHNDNSGASASADLAAYPDNGTDASGWIDMGITSSTYNDVAYPITGANEGYIFMSAPSGAGKTGNLVYATDSTGSQNYHQWYVGGFGTAKSAWEMQLTSSGLALANALSVGNGGTGATTAGAALTNLGAQETLVSGTNIKTINSTSLLGAGDVAVQPTLVSATNIKTINGASILGSGDLTVSGSFTGGTLTSELILAANSTSLTPLAFQAGTLNSTPVAGDMEYDGDVFYTTVGSNNRGVMPTEYFVVLQTNNTMTSQTAAQPLFDGGGTGLTNGALALGLGTFFFECTFYLTSLSTTSGSFGFALGGTATKTQYWEAAAKKSALATAAAGSITFNTAANTTLATASTTNTGYAKITGTIDITVAGTIIPQLSQTVAAAAVVNTGSYFRIRRMGSNSVAYIGNWS